MAVLSANTDWSKIEGVQAELADLFSGFRLEWYAERSDYRDRRSVPALVQGSEGELDDPRKRSRQPHRRGPDTLGVQQNPWNGGRLLYVAPRSMRRRPQAGRVASWVRGRVQASVARGVPRGGGVEESRLRRGKAQPARHARDGVLRAGVFQSLARHQSMGETGGRRLFRPRRSGCWPSWPPRRRSQRPRTSVSCSWTTPSGCCVRRDGLYLTNRELAEIAHEGGLPEDRVEGLGALIRSWTDEEGAGEQRETIEYLVRALDEDRLSDCKLFPGELKGKSW